MRMSWLLLVPISVQGQVEMRGVTEQFSYRVELACTTELISHTYLQCEISVADDAGSPILPRELSISGGMPGHGHGLPTTPRVVRQIGPGSFEIEGLKFNMSGAWQLQVDITGDRGPDRLAFDFDVGVLVPPSIRGAALTAAEAALAASLVVDQYRPAADPSNRFEGDPVAISLGKDLFHDRQLSGSGTVSCASCHDPKLAFTDGKVKSVGSSETRRNSQTLIGISEASWFYWDGRRDSLWAQNLTPIETPGEMDGTRVGVVRYVYSNPGYQSRLKALGLGFAGAGKLPHSASPFGSEEVKAAWHKLNSAEQEQVNRAFANVGKFLASYIATLAPKARQFDAYVAGHQDSAAQFNGAELEGLRLFLDVARSHCLRCHNGPMFTNFGFHNIGTGAAVDGLSDPGWAVGYSAATYDPFNCRGAYSDTSAETCFDLRFTMQADDAHAVGAFKVPTLRELARTGPYMHDGRFTTLRQVVDFYRETGGDPTVPELPTLDISDEEAEALVAFLLTLSQKPADESHVH